MKKHPILSSSILGLLLVFFFISCLKYEPPIDPGGGYYGINPELEELLEDADIHWDSIHKYKGLDTLNLRTDVLERPACNCAYRVIDFQYTTFEKVNDGGKLTFPNQTKIDAALWSSTRCQEGNPNSCLLFAGIYRAGKPRSYAGDTRCFDPWESLPPEGIFDFNCQVPPYSTFPVNFAISAEDLKSWEITFQIICQDSKVPKDCGVVDGQGYVSEPITLSYPGNAQTTNWAQTYLRMNKCGCRPIEVLLR